MTVGVTRDDPTEAPDNALPCTLLALLEGDETVKDTVAKEFAERYDGQVQQLAHTSQDAPGS